MDVTISASGTRDQALIDMQAQCKAAAAEAEGSWPLLATVRDYLAVQVRDAGPEDRVSLSATLSVRTSITKAVAAEVAAPAATPAYRLPRAKED
jgi:hypothetical protein